ncbi:MAG: hypothetical protein K1X86_00200 [Ignavibacteria bacterium]|nr:hypothetical protein [Ignavibacteria bacterium]
MERLNFFCPYQSKSPKHEDQLTRAFMVLMKYSFHVSSMFYTYCNDEYKRYAKDSNLPSLSQLINYDWVFETQKSDPIIDSELLISVLITDKELEDTKETVVPDPDRGARYDGIIKYGKILTMIIEVKPQSENVWFRQLNPSRNNLSEETQVLEIPVILEWKEIIKQLTAILGIPTLNSQEKFLIDDFLSFVDDFFPFLNPYDKFELCKNNKELLLRRIENILKEIVLKDTVVDYHRGWGNIIKVGERFKDFNQIGLILQLNESDKTWHLELSIYFADTVTQARKFYEKKFNWVSFKENGWEVLPNFHVSFRSQNLIYFKSNDIQKYLNYWNSNQENIRQYKIFEIRNFLEELSNKQIIIIEEKNRDDMNKKFFNTNMTTLNFCPGIGFKFHISSDVTVNMDNSNKLSSFIKERISEALEIIGYTKNEINAFLS